MVVSLRFDVETALLVGAVSVILLYALISTASGFWRLHQPVDVAPPATVPTEPRRDRNAPTEESLRAVPVPATGPERHLVVLNSADPIPESAGWS